MPVSAQTNDLLLATVDDAGANFHMRPFERFFEVNIRFCL